jgi:hypothetical protein
MEYMDSVYYIGSDTLLVDLGVDGRIVLKRIFNKQGVDWIQLS